MIVGFSFVGFTITPMQFYNRHNMHTVILNFILFAA